MVVVGAAILPHGTSIFDGDTKTESVACLQRQDILPDDVRMKLSKLYDGCLKTGKNASASQPDLVVLHTPHGISLSHSFGIYTNNTAAGNALWNDAYNEIEVSLPVDVTTSQNLLKSMRSKGFSVEGIQSFGGMDAPLRWGEVVPAWFINHFSSGTRYVILSQSVQMREGGHEKDRLDIGQFLHSYFQSQPYRVVFVISGDLSHVHEHSPIDKLYMPHPRSNLITDGEAAREMDRAFEGWVRGITDLSLLQNKSTPLEHGIETSTVWNADVALPWLERGTELQPTARSCGLVGFWILHAILRAQEDGGMVVKSTVHARESPVYFGMMAAFFHFTESS